ncbi:MAG: barstar family protein [Nitrospiraceae bacterium]
MPVSDPLLRLSAPWVYRVIVPRGQTAASWIPVPSEARLVSLDGATCRTKADLLRAMARAFAFPDYFDPNWDALEECLTDLEWFPADGYILVIDHADDVLADEPAERATWLAILRAAGDFWADSHQRVFRTLLATAPSKTSRSGTKAPTSAARTNTKKPAAWRLPVWSAQ